MSVETLFDLSAYPVTRVERQPMRLRDFVSLVEQEGVVISQAMAAGFLNVSPARVCQLVRDGVLRHVDVNGKPMVPLREIKDYLQLRNL